MWAIIGTWPFALRGVEQAARGLAAGQEAMEAAVQACRLIEDDETVDSVGRGGIPNREGYCELDAAVMDGRSLGIGAVAGLRHCPNAVLAARALLDHPTHNMLCGPGADAFAREQGLSQRPIETPQAMERWQALKRQQASHGHDTVCFLALSNNGRLASAVTTSGLGLKMPGRVGDSPLAGSGFYADDELGAAAATGLGEDIMRGLLSFQAVSYLKQGLHPQQAAEQAVLQAHQRMLRGGHQPDNMAVICLDKQGRYGAACNHQEFVYAAAAQGQPPHLVPVVPVIDNQRAAAPRELKGLR
jgi:isoaspartyl peptidase/L-asparaginase-like protein (Ntn-hydrolase superfamily)